MTVNFKELTDKAYKLHVSNKLDEAEKLYKTLIEISPEDCNVLNLYGLLCTIKGDYDKAITMLSKAVVLSNSPYIMCNLAKAYFSNGNTESAIKILNKSISLKPSDDAYYSLGIIYKKLKMFEEAANAYKKAIILNPKHYNSCYNLTLLLKNLNRYQEAIDYAHRCLDIMPNSEEIFITLSFLYEKTGGIAQAINCLEKAAQITPSNYLYFYNLGVLYSKLNDHENAIMNYLKVLVLKPDNVESLVNLCSLYRRKDINRALSYILEAKKVRPYDKNVLLNLAQVYKDLYENEKSMQVANEILEKYPDSHEAYSLLAVNCMDIGQYSNAADYYDKAIELCRENYSYLHGKAVSLKYLDRVDEFKNIMQKIINKYPESAEAKITYAMALLQEKDFYDGMKLYRERNNETVVMQKFKEKLWQPFEELENKNILVYSNCGLGDTIMYLRYINDLKKIAKNVIIQTDSALKDIIKYNYNDCVVFDKTEDVNVHYDIVVPFMDLGYALKSDFSNIPYPQGYLNIDEQIKSKFDALPELKTKKKKVGLVWQGNKRIFKNRSIEFTLLDSLLKNENIQFYSFQMNENISDNRILELKKYVKNYNDTAVLLSKMDLIISIDSSLVHMSGALGIAAYLLLPYTSEWRWFNDDKTTSWYNSVRIFKQKQPGDWKSVIRRVNTQLKKL